MPAATTTGTTPSARRVLVLSIATAMSFVLAGIAKAVTERLLASTGSTRYSTTAPVVDPMAIVDVVATVGACAAGAGVLLFGTTLVCAVLRHRGGRLPLGLAVVTVVLVGLAVASGIAAGSAHGFKAVSGLSTLRTAFAGLATASLPALVLGAATSSSLRRPRRAPR